MPSESFSKLLFCYSALNAVTVVNSETTSTSEYVTHPQYPSAYTAVLTLQLPYAGIDIPLTFQVDSDKNLEKIDYYQGLQSDFYIGAKNKYKYVYENAIRTCMKNEAPHNPMDSQSSDEEGGLVHALPQDLSSYKYVGKDLINGIEVDKYTLDQSHGSTGTMDDHLEFFHDPLLNKPVEWHMHSRNRIFGSHTDEYIVRYLEFLPSKGELEIELPKECRDISSNDDHKLSRTGRYLSFPAESIFGKTYKKSDSKDSSNQIDSLISPTFRLFTMQHGLHYGNNKHEWMKREKIFHKNVKTIKELNEKHKGVTKFKINKFGAMEVKELTGSRLGRKQGLGRRESTPSNSPHLKKLLEKVNLSEPKNFDWRTHQPGAIAPVRDQGICGSCWAFSLISAVESATYLANPPETNTHLEALPEQFVIDCTWSKDLAACDGGLSNVGARTIMKKYGGVFPTAKSYGSYLTVDGYCRAKTIGDEDEESSSNSLNSRFMDKTVTKNYSNTNPISLFKQRLSSKVKSLKLGDSASSILGNDRLIVGAKVTDFVDIPSRHESAVQAALLQQPLSIAYNVGVGTLFYDSGVLNLEECEQNSDADLNHAINLVGYGHDSESGLDYWLIRNSWSTYWGDQGYFKVVRGKRDCGVTTDAGYPVVEEVGKEVMYI